MDYKPYREELLHISDDMGLLSSYTQTKQEYTRKNREGFLCREAWARYIIDTVFWDISPKIIVHQRPQYDTFDADVLSGDTYVLVEAKCRNFKSGRYKTDNISVGKGDEIIREGGFLLVFFNDDGVYRIYDLGSYRPGKGTWRHRHYTAEAEDLDNYSQAEECWVLEPSKAIITGKLRKRNGGGEGEDNQ